MFTNIGLKLKVFSFILTVFSLLTVLDFYLFDNVLQRIQLQQGPQNTYNYLVATTTNERFKLIADAFKNARTVELKQEATKKKPYLLDTKKIPKTVRYSIADKTGNVISSNTEFLNNLKGIPAVDRALTSGIASDGIVVLKGKMYLLGVVPFTLQSKGRKRQSNSHFFIMVESKPILDVIRSFSFTFPIRAYINGKLVYEKNKKMWNKIFPPERQPLYKDAEKQLLQKDDKISISRWTQLVSWTLPKDFRSTGKMTIIALLSYTPGFAAWKNTLYLVIAYGLIAMFVSLLFVFVVTHEIDRVFRKLASSLSELKVGEKIVSKNYGHGAEIVVSALNTLISKYNSASMTNLDDDGIHEDFMLSKEPLADESEALADIGAESAQSPAISNFDPDDNLDDDEKTMIASAPPDSLPPLQQKQLSPFDKLWEEYRSIKIANGHVVGETDKQAFIEKLKKQRVSIIAKYDCRDVRFFIEERNGKPVIKAKKIQ